jgi:hypothetical protein
MVFQKDGDDLVVNYYQLASIIHVDNNLFIDKIKVVYNNNVITKNIS